MKETSFSGSIEAIATFDGPRAGEIAALFDRIMDLPSEPHLWQSAFSQMTDAQIEFYPWRVASVDFGSYEHLDLPSTADCQTLS